MRKLITILGFFLLTISVSGQIINASATYRARSSTSIYNANYQAVLDAMTTDPTGDTLTWQNEMVDSLDILIGFDRILYLNVYATTDNDGGEALIDWATPANSATNMSATAWTRLQGFTGDNTTDDYIDTNFDPGANVSLDDVTYGIYIRTPADQDANYPVQSFDGDNHSWYFRPRNTDDTYTMRINSTNLGITGASTDATGFWMATRRGATEVELYRNGASFGTGSTTSVGIPDADVFVVRAVPYQAAIFIVLDGISDAENVIINRIFERYLDHLGTGIQ